MESILQCRGLTKKYGNLVALHDVSLDLPSGQIIGLLGPNGSGKTTLIKLITSLLTQNEGTISIDGFEPGAYSKKLISYLPERTYLSDWMRVSDVIAYFEDFYDDFREDRAYDMLNRLQIDSSARLRTLSKGTKEKVQLILVMSRQARFYILDEPIGGVDPAARDYIMNTILTNYDPGATILISTHLISDIESILDYVIFLQYGQITLAAGADDIRMKHGKSIDTLFREVFRC